jgi:hypothetical protein
METPSSYVPSELQAGETAWARERAFTRWLSRDLNQAAADFCKNLGHVAAYCECSKEGSRFLPWQLPPDAGSEVRSARTKERFAEYDRRNQQRDWRLLSLHVSEDQLYSAVWITAGHYDEGVRFLRRYGVSAAQRIGP